MTKVRNENYIVIQGWMVSKLNLKGNHLLVYAIIYGFSQSEGQKFSGSIQYLVDWTNSSRRTVITCLNELVDKKLLEKNEVMVNGVKFCEYKAVVEEDVETSLGVQKLHRGSEEIAPNNIDNNLVKKEIYKEKRFVVPTLEEVAEYCKERNNSIDPQHFIDYYTSNGWMVGKNKMKDWKATVRTWEKNSKGSTKEKVVYDSYQYL